MNRATHYKKHSTPRERDIDFLLDREILGKIGFMAWFENQTRSRIIEAAVRYYFLRKKGVKNAFKRSKRNFKKTISVFTPSTPQ